MNKYIIVIILLSTFFLGYGLGIDNEPKIIYNNTTEYITEMRDIPLSQSWSNITCTTWNMPEPISKPKTTDRLMYPYGGVPSSIDNPPYNAVLDEKLSKAYQKPVAIKNGYRYYFVGGWGWFNQSEYNALPNGNKYTDTSPYWTVMK